MVKYIELFPEFKFIQCINMLTSWLCVLSGVIKLWWGFVMDPRACHSKAKSSSGAWGPRPGYEPSCPLSNYATLGNCLTSLKTQFSLFTRQSTHLPYRVVAKQTDNKCWWACELWNPIQMLAVLPGSGCSPDLADRWFHSQQTSDGCPDCPVHSFISSNGEEATWGQLFWTQSLTMGENGLGFPVHKAFHMHHLTWLPPKPREKMEACW